MKPEIIYRLKYFLSVDHNNGKGYTGDEIRASVKENDTIGACDILLLGSIIKPSDGGFSFQFYSYDGENEGKPAKNIDIFKAWTLMASGLKDDNTLPRWAHKICSDAFEAVKNNILA